MNLKQFREDAGLSCLELADAAKVSHWRLRRAESGHLELEAAELARIEAVIHAVHLARARLAQAYLRNGLRHAQAR